jgi:hypothetical protein
MAGGVNPSSGDSGIVAEQVFLSFSKMTWQYTKHSIRGGTEGTSSGGWDCAANKGQGMHFDELADRFDKLSKDGVGEFLGPNHKCVALPQFLTDVGYTGRWQPGPRVIDLDLLPSAVISNFKLVDGRPKFPNQHGGHVGGGGGSDQQSRRFASRS